MMLYYCVYICVCVMIWNEMMRAHDTDSIADNLKLKKVECRNWNPLDEREGTTVARARYTHDKMAAIMVE